MKTTKITDDNYTRKFLKEYIGKSLICKYWHLEEEDYIWVDCVEDPSLSGWFNYLFLEDWRIYGNQK